jgi:hypothetical protein
MNKRQIGLLILLLALAGVAFYMLKDSFAAPDIQITYSIRPLPPNRQAQARRRATPSGLPGYVVAFGFDQKVSLTGVKVFPLQDVLTNKYPHPIWNLTSESNSPPLKSIVYGGYIHGLHPAVKGATPDALEPGTKYRLIVETKDRQAEKDFEMPK